VRCETEPRVEAEHEQRWQRVLNHAGTLGYALELTRRHVERAPECLGDHAMLDAWDLLAGLMGHRPGPPPGRSEGASLSQSLERNLPTS
jgi:hypothetical protein